MKWRREEYIELMTFGRVERQMFCELFGPLVGLDKEWHSQGATQEEINLVAFDWDYVSVAHCGGNNGLINPKPSVILEDNEEFTIRTNEHGMKEKLIKSAASIFHPMEYLVNSADDWLKIKPQYEFAEERISWDQVERANKLQNEGSVVLTWIPGGFDFPRTLMGEERLCYAYFDEPELIKDMLDTIGETVFKVLDRISDKLMIDVICVHEDMAGKSGALIGPSLIERFIKPYYLKIWDMLKSKGTRIFSQDSDGNMNSVMDVFLDCGLTQMYPMEPGSGMDVVELRKKYGRRVAFKGGIDKYVLLQDKEAIRKELEYKMQPLMKEGGMVFGIDHRIPNGTPLENYRYYVETGREILGLPPLNNKQKGWRQMAF